MPPVGRLCQQDASVETIGQSENMIGSLLKDTYRIYDKVGAGGFATVYLGRNLRTNEVVAIKVLREQYTGDPAFVRRFSREAAMAQKLDQANIVRMIDHGVESETHYLVMEYVEGRTVAELVQERGALPVDLAVSIGSQVCLALEEARQKGVIHRDIKPHNIMVTPSGVVKVMDFGIARGAGGSTITQTGMVLGTPRYLAPEALKGEKADIRGDLYALGIVLYEMLTGTAPFVADSPWALMRQHIEAPPPTLHSRRRDVPDWLEQVVARALAKDPAQRFQTPQEMLAALGGAERLTPIPAPSGRSNRRTNLGVIIGVVAVLFLVGAVLALALWLSQQPVPPASATANTITPDLATLSVDMQPTDPTPTSLPATARPSLVPTSEPVTATATESPTPVPMTATPVIIVVTASPTPTTEATLTPRPSVTPAATSSPVPTQTWTPSPEPPPSKPASTATRAPAATSSSLPASSLAGRIAFAVVEGGTGKYILYSIGAGSGEILWLGDYLRQPAYRQDGLEILANGEGGGLDDLWLIQPDGSRIKAHGHLDDERPLWLQARSGYHIGFDSLRRGDGNWRIYLSDEAISSGKGAILGRYPVALPGELLAYSGCDYGFGTGSKCGLWKVSMWGGIPIQLLDDPNDIPTGGGDDGVLFMRQEEGNWDVYLVGAGGGHPVRLTDDPGQDGLATFSPDGRTLAFLSNRTGTWALWLMARNGSNQRKLLDLPGGGGYGSRWTEERLSWGPLPAAPAPAPTQVGADLLPAPQITFPIPDDEVSSRERATITIFWTWNGTLGANQAYEVRFWHTSESSPMGLAAPTREQELPARIYFSESYQRNGDGFYHLEVVVVQLEPYKVLSRPGRIRVRATVNK